MADTSKSDPATGDQAEGTSTGTPEATSTSAEPIRATTPPATRSGDAKPATTEPQSKPEPGAAAGGGTATGTRGSAPASSGSADPNPLRGSRTSGVWIGLVALGVLLVLLVIFITQNTQEAQVKFLSWEGRAPQAALLLASAVAGLFLTVIAGSLRILQLRRRVKQHEKLQKKQLKKQQEKK